jgi:hypothetical protein
MERDLGHLPLAELRQTILNCQACFLPGTGCRHHEDAVGGYDPERIAVIGINPQAAPGEKVYESIQQANWKIKLALSDRLLDIFSGQATFETVHPAWSWMNRKHKGVRNWLPRVQKHFGVQSGAILARNFVFLETFKHATASQPALEREPTWEKIRRLCPGLMIEQLVRIRPRLVGLCGSSGLHTVAPLLGLGALATGSSRAKITHLHGRTEIGGVRGQTFPVLFTIAVSSQTSRAWKSNSLGTASVQAVIQDHLR